MTDMGHGMVQAAFSFVAHLPPPVLVHRERQARTLAPSAPSAQLDLLSDVVALPATRADCRGPGICPVLRCRHNIALWVKDNGAIKAEGAVGRGRTVRATRSATDDRLEAIAEYVAELADRLPSLCSLDYADEGRVGPKALRKILGLQPRRMTKLLADAAEELDIARARQRRQDAAAKAEQHQRRQVERTELVQIKRKPKPCK